MTKHWRIPSGRIARDALELKKTGKVGEKKSVGTFNTKNIIVYNFDLDHGKVPDDLVLGLKKSDLELAYFEQRGAHIDSKI